MVIKILNKVLGIINGEKKLTIISNQNGTELKN